MEDVNNFSVVIHYYKCFRWKRQKYECSKKNITQKVLKDLVFENTVEYVLRPEIITAIAEKITKKFNSEITKTNLEKELKEKSIAAILKAIEQLD